jgi:hypothetical protein
VQDLFLYGTPLRLSRNSRMPELIPSSLELIPSSVELIPSSDSGNSRCKWLIGTAFLDPIYGNFPVLEDSDHHCNQLDDSAAARAQVADTNVRLPTSRAVAQNLTPQRASP